MEEIKKAETKGIKELVKCSTCKFWNTDREEFKKPGSIGWGFCTNNKIRTGFDDWFSLNEKSPSRESIVTDTYKGFLTDELKEKGINGQFKTGENFGCIHHISSDDKKPKVVTKEFLINEGWKIKNEYPLIIEFVGNNERFTCSLGRYNSFSLTEWHWINKDEPVRFFGTIGKETTEQDYFKIIELTGIDI